MSSPIKPPPPDIRNTPSSPLPPPPPPPPSSSSSSTATVPTSSPSLPQTLPPPLPITSNTMSRPTSQRLPSPKLSEIPFQSTASSHSSSALATSGPAYSSPTAFSSTQNMPSLPSPSVLTGASSTTTATEERMATGNNSATAAVHTTQLPSIAPPPTTPPPPPPRSSAVSSISTLVENRTQTSGTATAGGPRLTSQPTTTTTTTTRQPSPSPQQQQPPQTNNDNTNYRPLNVRDALTYLDQVKVQFSARPDVYNQFLDIMKDFKSQAIDTPGVIERVSILFNGHPELISGFNTFLPPGYRIECSMDPNEPDMIKVTTPAGTILKRTNAATMGMMDPRQQQHHHHHEMLHPMQTSHHHHPHHHPHPPPPPPHPGHYYQTPYGHMPSATHGPPTTTVTSSSTTTTTTATTTASLTSTIPPPSSSLSHPPPPPPHHHHHHPSYLPGSRRPGPPLPAGSAPQSQPQPPSSMHPSEDQSTTATTTTNGNSAHTRRAPVEFNHAINYVNKIKNRFANEPDTYKQFLEILQTYQKERKPIQEVYAHVQYLFSRAPDLLQEFKQFLPEITGQPAPELLDELDAYSMGSKRPYGMTQGGGMLSAGKKKRGGGKRTKGQRVEEEIIEGFPASSYYDPIRPTVSNDDVELFDQIRKHIGNKPSYEEFLKLLNLFTQQIIDIDALLKQAEGFLGTDKDLFAWFKNTVAVDVKEQTIDQPAAIVPKPDLNQCTTVDSSPSYRLVSQEWQNQPCSGRDQLCWEVLNDEYVSHPIWASEDSGFVASKKNQYEEAMHRCEEERYDYDLNIDANLNVLALLEPIAEKLETMTPEQKSAFRLEPGLGGQSVTIYERIIKKIYEEDRGLEVIEMLYSNPARVVPILLRRLTQKDEEWRKAQHECNKTWREMDAKNFYRSLDYQGHSFKTNDRKAMSGKVLVAEIETLHDEASASRDDKENKKYPLRFSFGDSGVFKDVTRVIFSYIEKQNGFSSNDRSKIRIFMRIFIPLFFHVEDTVPEGMDIESDNDEEDDEDAQSMNTEESDGDVIGRSPRDRSRSPSRNRKRSGRSRTDDTDVSVQLLRDVLTKKRKNTPAVDDNDITPRSNDHENTPSSDQTIKREDTTSADEFDSVTNGGGGGDSMTRSPQEIEPPNGTQGGDRLFAAATAPGSEGRTIYTFFCNTAFYSFFRLYQMMYERLAKMKRLDEEMRNNPDKGKKINAVALELGLYSSRFDDVNTSNGYYNALLDLIDRLFDGDLDQIMFEEKARYLFATEAYVLFTIDKLVHSIIKQMQVVTMEEKCVELVELLRSDQSRDTTSSQTIASYRQRAERIVDDDENLYRINFNTETHRMTIQLLERDDDVPEQEEGNRMDWTNETQATVTESKRE